MFSQVEMLKNNLMMMMSQIQMVIISLKHLEKIKAIHSLLNLEFAPPESWLMYFMRLTRSVGQYQREHTHHHSFATAFSDPMLVPDKNDKLQVEAYLRDHKLSNWDKTTPTVALNGVGKRVRGDIFQRKGSVLA